MKSSLILLATCGLLLTQGASNKHKSHDEPAPVEPTEIVDDTFVYDTMTRLDVLHFSFNITQHFWAGFLDGWYLHSKNKKKVTEECFGTWIEDNFWEVDNVFWKIVSFDWMNLEKGEVKKAADDMIDIFFR